MSSPHVLVVDDEADIRALIQDILTDEGYGVTVAANAGEARTARTKRKFDLILLDIWMPDTDGITLLREWSDIPFPTELTQDDIRWQVGVLTDQS